MNKKAFIVVLLVLVLFSLNFSVAHEIDNSTGEVSSTPINSDILAISGTNQTILKDTSQLKTQIDIKSNTTFDVYGDYFKISLVDEKGNPLTNTNVTFTLAGVTYTKATDGNGIASLQLKLNDGSYKITTKFLGNSKYKASSKTTIIVINNTRIVSDGLSNSEIQKIIDDAKDKNVILFNGSSYSGINLVITKRLTLVSYSNTILNSGSKSPVITIKGKNASATTIKGFKIQGDGNGIVVSGSDYVTVVKNDITTKGNGIVATGTKYLNITQNNIVKNSKAGIILGNATSTYIFNNKISSNGGDGIEVAKSSNVYIHNNTISSNKGSGIHLATSANGKDYGKGPENVYINENKINKNTNSGILINDAENNVNINSNTVEHNYESGIAIAHMGSNKIQSNVITENYGDGISFFDNYVKPKSQEISYNAIFSNSGREIEAKDTNYKDSNDKLQIGENWYSDYNTLCPKINSKNLQFVVKQTGENQFQATFLDSKGNIANLLPDRELTVQVGDGKSVSVTVSGGVATFSVDAVDGDLVKAIADDSKRENNYDSQTSNSEPVNGKTPSYSYPAIPYDSVGGGNGDGMGDGLGGDANQGDGSTDKGGSDNTGNSTHTQKSNPTSNPNNPIDDVSQSYETEVTSTGEGASQSSSNDASTAGSQSVVKQIVIEDDDIYRVTGISLIVLLIILTIGLYYRDDIKEMNSKR